MAGSPSGGASRSLSAVLIADPALCRWVARAAKDRRIESVVRAELPAGVASLTRVLDAESAQLVLGCANGASTLAVRRSAPSLLAGLRRAGFDFAALRVVVVPRFTPRPARRSEQRRIDKRGAAALAALAADLPEGALRAAIARLASHHQHQALEQEKHQNRAQDQQREADHLADE